MFERADRIGGLLRYGIPDFKMEKRYLDRRLDQMKAEGVVFRPSTNIGVDISATGTDRPGSTPSAFAAAPPSRETCRSRGGTSKASTSPCSF